MTAQHASTSPVVSWCELHLQPLLASTRRCRPDDLDRNGDTLALLYRLSYLAQLVMIHPIYLSKSCNLVAGLETC